MKKLFRLFIIVVTFLPVNFIFAAMSLYSGIVSYCDLCKGGYTAYKRYYKTGDCIEPRHRPMAKYYRVNKYDMSVPYPHWKK